MTEWDEVHPLTLSSQPTLTLTPRPSPLSSLTQTAMAMGWNHTRTVHPTFELVVRELAEGGQSGQIRGGGGGGSGNGNAGVGEFTGAIGDTGMGEDFEGQIGIITPVPGSRAGGSRTGGSRAPSRGGLLIQEEANRRSARSGGSRGGGSSRGGGMSQGGSRPGTVTFDVDSAASLSGGMVSHSFVNTIRCSVFARQI